MTTTPPAAVLAETLPELLPGHYSTADGREMLGRYIGIPRAEAGGDMTDTEIAHACGMASGRDIESISTLHRAKERIRWLSAQLAAITALEAEAQTLRDALEPLLIICERHIYPQPDKPDSAWAEVVKARAAWTKGKTE